MPIRVGPTSTRPIEKLGIYVMVTKITVEIEEDVADFLNNECRRQNKPIGHIVNQVVRQHMPENSQIKEYGKRFRIKPFDGGFAPEFEGMTPKEILNQLDDEYYAKKLAGGTEAYEAMKAKNGSNPG